MKARSARWSLLLFLPLLVVILSCATTAPASAPKAAEFANQQSAPPPNGPKEASDVYIIVDVDEATKAITVSPNPAFATVRQRVTWVSTNPALDIEIFWKPGTGGPADPPCPKRSPRCGGKTIPVPAGSHLQYGVRAYRGTTEVGFVDPELEILP
ncbi:MAG TPA: hypothetical protein VGF40_08655 [Thermoanaerobaculia bacterium]